MTSNVKKLLTILNLQEKRRVVALIVTMVFVAFLEMVSIGIIIPLTHLFINPDNFDFSSLGMSFFNETDSKQLIIIFSLGIVLFFLIKFLVIIAASFFHNKVIYTIQARMSCDILKQYTELPYQFHINNNSSYLFRNITTETDRFITYLNSLVSIISDVSVLIFLVLLMGIQHPFIMLSMVSFLGFISLFIYLVIIKKVLFYSKYVTIYGYQYQRYAMEVLSGIKEILVFDAIKYFLTRFNLSIKTEKSYIIKRSTINKLPRYFIETITFVVIVLVMSFSLLLAWKTEDVIMIMATLGFSALKILPSIANINTNIEALRYYENSIDILHNNTSLVGQTAIPDREDLPKGIGTLSITKLSFSYQTDRYIFHNFSLAVPPLKTVALVGESGSGKSTLISIITGLLSVQEGNIIYNGTLIGSKNIFSFRQRIGYVPQEIFLYDASLAENIAFGYNMEAIDLKQLNVVIKLAQLEAVVETLEEGIYTNIGEKGGKLSGGQRQRVGIARALYRQPDILIFDEATSALDNNTEMELNQAIKKLKNSVTIIMAAHRLQTIQQADLIYVLEQGKLVAEGTFDELFDRSEIFQTIINIKK